MRPRLPLLGLLASLTIPATAAADGPRRDLTAGVQLGGNLSSLGGSSAIDVTSMGQTVALESELTVSSSITAGLFGAYRASDRLGLRVELHYAERGASGNQFLSEDRSASVSFRYRMRYLELPLLATYTFPYDGVVHYELFAGPSLGLLLSSDLTGDGSQLAMDGSSVDLTVDRDLADDTSNPDFAAVAGAGISLPLSRGRLTLDVRYTVGIPKTVDAVDEPVVPGAIAVRARNLRHRVLAIMAGWEL